MIKGVFMLRVFVDSGSSIKEDEKEKYQVEILPIRYMLGDTEYEDGKDLTIDEFYDIFINKKYFPKTSLPNLADLEEKVNKYTKQGDDVLILTISSGISGTNSAITSLFADNEKVKVVDTLTAVGGIRILVEEVNKHRDEKIEDIVNRINDIIPRIKVVAVPETLDYLHKGGRLSKAEWLLGSVLNIKPAISVWPKDEGRVKVIAKKIGAKNAMKYVANSLVEFDCDENFSIVPSYTYNKKNLDLLIAMTDEKFKKQMIEYDNLDPAIACHWGPNAYGYIFVSKK